MVGGLGPAHPGQVKGHKAGERGEGGGQADHGVAGEDEGSQVCQPADVLRQLAQADARRGQRLEGGQVEHDRGQPAQGVTGDVEAGQRGGAVRQVGRQRRQQVGRHADAPQRAAPAESRGKISEPVPVEVQLAQFRERPPDGGGQRRQGVVGEVENGDEVAVLSEVDERKGIEVVGTQGAGVGRADVPGGRRTWHHLFPQGLHRLHTHTAIRSPHRACLDEVKITIFTYFFTIATGY